MAMHIDDSHRSILAGLCGRVLKITIGDSKLVNVCFGPACGVNSDISRNPSSARFGHGGVIRFRDAVDHVGDAQRSSDARTTGLWPSVLMQIKAEFQGFF
jgi:hypothetical protein